MRINYRVARSCPVGRVVANLLAVFSAWGAAYLRVEQATESKDITKRNTRSAFTLVPLLDCFSNDWRSHVLTATMHWFARSSKVQYSKTAKVQDRLVPMKTPIFDDDHCLSGYSSTPMSGSRFGCLRGWGVCEPRG